MEREKTLRAYYVYNTFTLKKKHKHLSYEIFWDKYNNIFVDYSHQLKISLSPAKVEDKLIWPYVPNSVYSVKSGYRFLVKDKPGPLLYHFSQGEDPSIWSRIWRLSVPKKSKTFFGRLARKLCQLRKIWSAEESLRKTCAAIVNWRLKTVTMLCGTVLSFQQSGKLTLCGYFAGLRSFQIFLSLQDLCWRMTDN